MFLDVNTLSQDELARLQRTAVVEPPQGITSNFENPETRIKLQVTITSVLLGIALLCWIHRIYVKLCLMKKMTGDDATLLVAVLCGLTYYVSSTWAVQKGNMARHLWDVNLLQAQSPDVLIPWYITFILPPIALVFLKASFFLLYLQLFYSVRWVCICSKIGLCIISTIHITIGAYSFAIASPYNSQWLPKAEKVGLPAAILGFLVDLSILVIPVIAISRLEAISRRRKIGALLIFLTGGLACFCSAFSIRTRRRMCKTVDKTWHEVAINITTLCELFVGIICACAPSAVYGFKQTNSIWQMMYRKIQPVQRKLGHNDQPRNGHPGPDALKSTDRKYARYLEVTDSYGTISPQYTHMRELQPVHLKSATQFGKYHSRH